MIRDLIYSIKDSWVDWLQLLSIGLVAPLFLFPSMKYVWVFLLVPIILIWRWLAKKNFFERSVLDWAILILIIQVFTTCLIVTDLTFSLPKITGVLFGIIFFYLTINLLRNKKIIRAGTFLFLLGGLILSIASIFGMSRHDLKYRNDLNKIYKLIPKIDFNLPGAEEGFNENAVGGTLILIIPLFIILSFARFQQKKQDNLLYKNRAFFILSLMGLLITIIALWLTHSRGSYVGLLLSIWLILMWGFHGKKWALIGLILILIFIAVYLVSVGLDNIPVVVKDVKNKFDLRFRTWKLAIEKINSAPVTGIGMNQLRKHPLLYYKRAHAHNHLLHTATELGIPGLVAYLAILIGAGFMCFNIWRKSNIVWMRMMALGLGCGQLAHFIFGMADSIPLGAKVGIFFWFSLALITALYNYMLKRDIGSD